MRSSEIRLRKLKLRLRDKRLTNHEAIWQPLQSVLALRGCSATDYHHSKREILTFASFFVVQHGHRYVNLNKPTPCPYGGRGRRLIGISGSLIWSKTLMELMFNPCGEFRRSPEGSVSQIHSPHLLVGAPGIFSDLLRSVQMLKREWGCGKPREATVPIHPSKTAT